MMFKPGKKLTSLMIANKVKISQEWARLNILKLVAKKMIVKNKSGKIINVK